MLHDTTDFRVSFTALVRLSSTETLISDLLLASPLYNIFRDAPPTEYKYLMLPPHIMLTSISGIPTL